MWWFKGCPRCGGDIYEEQETDGLYIACLQCGYYLREIEMVRLKLSRHLVGEVPTAEREKVAKAA
ncbi:MAG: hypothetical protein HYY31_03940 [Chloroflexi bacterium]|nr:hypothetical protein [Chloroflexota bacterium]